MGSQHAHNVPSIVAHVYHSITGASKDGWIPASHWPRNLDEAKRPISVRDHISKRRWTVIEEDIKCLLLDFICSVIFICKWMFAHKCTHTREHVMGYKCKWLCIGYKGNKQMANMCRLFGPNKNIFINLYFLIKSYEKFTFHYLTFHSYTVYD